MDILCAKCGNKFWKRNQNTGLACALTIQLCLSVDECQDGFKFVPGDVHGGSDIPGGSLTNIKSTVECGDKCLITNACRSYEYSPSLQKCNLNTAAEPDRGVYQDFAFCVRGNYFVDILSIILLAHRNIPTLQANYPWTPRIWGKEENFEWMFIKEHIIDDRRNSYS